MQAFIDYFSRFKDELENLSLFDELRNHYTSLLWADDDRMIANEYSPSTAKDRALKEVPERADMAVQSRPERAQQPRQPGVPPEDTLFMTTTSRSLLPFSNSSRNIQKV